MVVRAKTNKSTRSNIDKDTLAKEGIHYQTFPSKRTQPGLLKQLVQGSVLWLWVGSLIFCIAILPLICIYLAWEFVVMRILLLLYGSWIILDSKSAFSGRESSMIKRYLCHSPIWDYFRGYFSARLVKTCDLDPCEKYILGYALFNRFHPHGVYALSLMSNVLFNRHFSTVFPGIDICMPTLPINFYLPFWRELALGAGGVTCHKQAVVGRIANGRPGTAMLISLGGAEEFYHMNENTLDLVILKRKGFAKIALQTGANLVPVIGFGENELFERLTHQIFDPLHALFNATIRAAAPLFRGKNWGLPARHPLVTVVGKPIAVKRTPNPTEKEVEKLHKQYLEALQSLYDEYKDIFHDYRHMDMRFVA